eukprot:2557079-Lingulodinium_polyedra.AAC.1
MELREASRGGMQELRGEVAEERRLRASEVRLLTDRLQGLREAQCERVDGLAAVLEEIRGPAAVCSERVGGGAPGG